MTKAPHPEMRRAMTLKDMIKPLRGVVPAEPACGSGRPDQGQPTELLDVGLSQLGAPVALTGIIIAAIVFLPETITTLRASWMGEIQRVSNLTQGALVSSVGLTVPTVLLIGLVTGQTVVFAESPANLMLLAVTALLSVSVAAGRRVGAVHGIAHLMVFAMYVLSVFV